MKRENNLYQQVYSMDNLRLADKNARKGKSHRTDIKLFDENREANLLAIHESLKNKTFTTSPYKTFIVYEPKERLVSCLPYIDRIVHYAIINILKQKFLSMFTVDTYSCIEGKGIHGAFDSLKKALKDVPGTTYCLKLDIKKFYPNVNHDVLKEMLRRKIKDVDLLWLLDDIIDSADGLPIGNLLSQYFANLYLTGFDHWIKEVKRELYYWRYMDDIVLLSNSKDHLHKLLAATKEFFNRRLILEIKSNYQIFPVAARGIDFVGYVFFHYYIRIRKSIKKNFARKMAKRKSKATIDSYNGWLTHCDAKHLFKKIVHE